MALSLRVRSALFFFLPFGIVSIILFLGFLTASISKTTDLTSKIQTSMPSPLASPSATVTTQPSTTEVLGRATATTNEQLLAIEKLFLLINAHRDEHHIPKVRLHPKLIASAQLKLNDMISKGYYQHEDENKQTTWEFIQLAGYHYSIAGENLAFNIGSEWDIFTAWKESETHNKEMLHPLYTDVGIAIDCDSIEDPEYKCML